jgi:hypothetical protein
LLLFSKLGVHDDLSNKTSAFTDIVIVVSSDSFLDTFVVFLEVRDESTSNSGDELTVLLEVGEVGKFGKDIIEMGEVAVTITEVRILKQKITRRWCWWLRIISSWQ